MIQSKLPASALHPHHVMFSFISEELPGRTLFGPFKCSAVLPQPHFSMEDSLLLFVPYLLRHFFFVPKKTSFFPFYYKMLINFFSSFTWMFVH